MAQNDRRTPSQLLRNLRNLLNRAIENDRASYSWLAAWQGPLPVLRRIMSKEAIDRLLVEAVNFSEPDTEVIDFLIRTGYRDEPDLDENGLPLLRRTTALHVLGRRPDHNFHAVDKLFKIYSCFGANYVDEDGLTHFHVACKSGCDNVVRQFLAAGEDPDLLLESTGESPLHLALRLGNRPIVEALLKIGADPNLADDDGIAPLHVCAREHLVPDLALMLFELCCDEYQPVRVNAQDERGNTPLHYAVENEAPRKMTRLLLGAGADPNSANFHGVTPLHRLCRAEGSHEELKLFFESCDEIGRTVWVDAPDERGRTPLEWAVANLQPQTVEVLLDRGADLSKFVFPDEDYFAVESNPQQDRKSEISIKCRSTSCALTILEILEKRGYRPEPSDALTIMKLFDRLGLFLSEANARKTQHLDYATKATTAAYAVQLDYATKGIATYAELSDYATKDLARIDRPGDPMIKQLWETMSRRFFRRWALDYVRKLTGCKLPIICYEQIIETMRNEDLYHICLAVQERSS